MKKTSGPIRLAAACLLLCLLSACIPAGEKPEEAAPPLPLVEDRAGVLAPATVERMERDGAVLRDLTGAEIVVVTVEFLGGRTVEEAARFLFEERAPGALDQGNGMLLLLCTGEEDYYLLTGEGLAQSLPPERLRELLDQCLEEDFDAGNYDAGASALFEGLLGEAEQLYGVSVSEELARREAGHEPPEEGTFLRAAPWFFLFLACLMFFLYFRVNRRRRRKMVRRKNSLQE
ncbi:hypothetical protein CE91St46_23930 [Eubacteriales bacterium]|nr:TPM domain-containing protein [Faecalicatena sp. BF-R-105]GKH51282.1 hypothetical protein CE91St46_23930 [Eubacteriales bacterium]GKH64000.1 hypothetical protein CE91St47_24690 [Eubacteriales bacterium]